MSVKSCAARLDCHSARLQRSQASLWPDAGRHRSGRGTSGADGAVRIISRLRLAEVFWGMKDPFRYFNSSPEVIRLVVMMYVKYPLSLRNVEDLLAERGIGISHETVRFWWNRFGPIFAAEIRKRRVAHVRSYPQWRWHLDEVLVKINGKLCYLWRAVDNEGEVLDTVATVKRDRAAARPCCNDG